MGRTFRIILLAALAATMAACGGSSSPSSSAAKLSSGDVAVVGGTHITTDQLDHQIKLEVRAMQLKKQAVPKVGTSSYTTSVVQPVLAYLVTDAQVHNIAQQLSVTTTPKEIQAQVTKAVAQYYGGSKAKYQADLKKYGLTDADISQQFELTLLEQKIEAKLRNQVSVTDKQVQDYYNAHKSQYADTRKVDYVLEPSKAAAESARAAIMNGKSFKDVAKGAIDDSGSHEPFVATKGQVDKSFQDVAFTLATNQLSALVPVDKAYIASQPSLKGKCKPTCYFVIRPTADVQKQTFASLKAQIRSTLLSTKQQAHLQAVVSQLEKQQKKLTHYAAGYKPVATTSSTSAGSGTATS
jgi:PPIC-type PPIASE domain/SurA-like N-terminal domain